jgi:hypothetical protein
MTSQPDIFDGDSGANKPGPEFPEGFRYRPGLITPDDEASLLTRVRELPFREFELHGYTGRRGCTWEMTRG